MKEKVIEKLIRGGYNAEQAKAMTEAQWDFISRCYADATVKKAADIVAKLGTENESR